MHILSSVAANCDNMQFHFHQPSIFSNLRICTKSGERILAFSDFPGILHGIYDMTDRQTEWISISISKPGICRIINNHDWNKYFFVPPVQNLHQKSSSLDSEEWKRESFMSLFVCFTDLTEHRHIFRRFVQHSTLNTYLTGTVTHFPTDELNEMWVNRPQRRKFTIPCEFTASRAPPAARRYVKDLRESCTWKFIVCYRKFFHHTWHEILSNHENVGTPFAKSPWLRFQFFAKNGKSSLSSPAFLLNVLILGPAWYLFCSWYSLGSTSANIILLQFLRK